MTLDDLPTQWRTTNEAAATREQREQLIAATRHRVNRLWGQILRRDVTETIAAVFVGIFFGRYVFATNLVVSMSALWLVWWALKIVYKMHRTRTIRKPASLDAPVREFCRIELDRLDRQIQLQRRVLWWYIAPCMVGVNAFFIGLAGFGIASVVYCIVTLLLAWGIFALNMRAVAKGLVPARDELASLLSQLDGAAASPSSLASPVSVEGARSDAGRASKLGLLADAFYGASVGPAAAAKSSVLVAKFVALVSLIIGLFVA